MSAHLIGVTGNPGEGKSDLARSATVVGKTAVLLTDPKEVGFWKAPENPRFKPENLTTVDLIVDSEWRPHLGTPEGLKAGGYTKMMRWFDDRSRDDSEFVVVDTGTEATVLSEHECLKAAGVFNVSDLEYGRGYTGTATLNRALVNEWRRLFALGKTVIVTFHARMKEMEGAGEAQKKKAMSGEMEWRFDEQMLPVVTGTNAVAQSFGSPFDLWLYTKPQGVGANRRYFVTALPDTVRPAKHSVTFKEKVDGKPVLPGMLPNSVQAILGVIA